MKLLGHMLTLHLTFKEVPDCFPKQLQHLHFHQQHMRVPISPHPCQHLFLSIFLMIAILVGVKMVSHYGFNLHFAHGEMLNFFMCLLSICVSSLKKCLLRSFAHFQLGYLSYHNWVLRVLYVFYEFFISSLWVIWLAKSIFLWVVFSLSWKSPLKHKSF